MVEESGSGVEGWYKFYKPRLNENSDKPELKQYHISYSEYERYFRYLNYAQEGEDCPNGCGLKLKFDEIIDHFLGVNTYVKDD